MKGVRGHSRCVIIEGEPTKPKGEEMENQHLRTKTSKKLVVIKSLPSQTGGK